MTTASDDLRTAITVQNLVKSRAPEAWPLADALADALVERSLDEVANELKSRPRPRVPSCGALKAWREEVRRGVGDQHPDKPSTWRPCHKRSDGTWSDPLRAAAAREAEAADWDRQGMPETADRCRLEAARILAEAAKRQSEAA